MARAYVKPTAASAIKKPGARKKREILFYSLMMALPLAQFAVFYIGVNVNSLLLAFQRFERGGDSFVGTFVWNGWQNFASLFREIATQTTIRNVLVNSICVWGLCTFITLPLALLFSFYIFKKMPAAGFFRFSLFLPSIIPAIATVIMYMYFVERAMPALNDSWQGLLSNPDTQFVTVLFYNIFYAFGSYVLLLTSSMNTVDESTLEASELDGAKGGKQFLYIIMPKVYPTLSTFLILSIAGIFANQFSLFSFFGTDASLRVATFGYYLYTQTLKATYAEYPRLAAMGLLLTAIVVPVTLSVKTALERLGPKE